MNINRLICVGLSHQTAPIELREQLSHWPQGDIRTDAIEELVILSTCNRLELYACLADNVYFPNNGAAAQQALVALIEAIQGLPSALFTNHLYVYQGNAAAYHLCRVAAGLDSLVLGEAQILGQVNSTFQKAQAARTIGPVLSLLFRLGIKAGRRARTETHISANPVSVGSAALNLAHQVTGGLYKQQIAVVGLGEIGQLTLKGLRTRGVNQVTLVNRSLQRAQTLAASWGGVAYGLADLPQALRTADVVISATSAIEPIIHTTTVAQIMAQRPSRPLIFLDLAVPRDIDAAVKTIPGVQLFDVDDLRNSVDSALLARQQETPRVEQIIEEVLCEWRHQFQELQIRPVVVELRQKAEQIRQRAVERTLHHLGRHLGEVDSQTADQLWHLSNALVNQLLHEPTRQLKRKAGQQQADLYANLVSDLFGLSSVFTVPDEEEASP